jgi:hypothetical protein
MHRPNKIGALTAAAALAAPLALTIAAAAPADADTPGCVSRAEFRRIDTKGPDAHTRPQVTRIFDTRGHITSTGSGGTDVEYRTCAGDPDWSYAEVDFEHRHAWFKWIYISY